MKRKGRIVKEDMEAEVSRKKGEMDSSTHYCGKSALSKS